MTEQVNLHINDGATFFAHEVSINFTPTQFTLDFKCITPRVDPRDKRPSFLMQHNVVMVEPWHAKMVCDVLGSVVKKYEEEFGKISKPKSLEKAEKKHKANVKEQEQDESTKAPTYMG